MSSFVNPISFPTNLKRKADGLISVQVIDISTGQEIKLGVTINWEEINGQIVINHITGLKKSTKYRIKVLII